MKLVSFEIFDGENSYEQYSIFKTDISKLDEFMLSQNGYIKE